MTYLYVFHVITGREHKISNTINKKFNTHIANTFIPKREKVCRKVGNIYKKDTIMFPGYVFIESELYNEDFYLQINHFVKCLKDVITILRYGDTNEYAVREDERNKLMLFLNSKYCMELSTGFIEGDKIYIIDGPMAGRESIIRKINRHKMEAVIELNIMGGNLKVTIPIDIISKI